MQPRSKPGGFVDDWMAMLLKKQETHRCLTCMLDGKPDHHPDAVNSCTITTNEAKRLVRMLQAQHIPEWDDYVCCFQCGYPQWLCPKFLREDDANGYVFFKRNSEGMCSVPIGSIMVVSAPCGLSGNRKSLDGLGL